LFPHPDLFIIDGIGDIECHSERFCRQIMTIFESRIPVVIVLNNENHPAFQKMKEIAPFHFVRLEDDNHAETYSKLLSLLN
jgi:nucleoside-triphosphatase THEP1